MTHRTTFALDKATVGRIRRLAARWQVSQAEVVRRAVQQAEGQGTPIRPDPVSMLRELHASGGGLERHKAEAYLAEVYEDRENWRAQ